VTKVGSDLKCLKLRNPVHFIKKMERHAAHTPRKRVRCGSACAARAKP